jgi:hypothetical protein
MNCFEGRCYNFNKRLYAKEEAEDVYFIDPFDKLSSTQPTDQFPKTQFQYNLKITGEGLTPGASANVVRRFSEGMILIEVGRCRLTL